MMRIGVQSKGILDDEMSDLESGFDKIQAAGFDCIDLNLDTFLKNSEIYEGKINLFFDQSAEQLRDCFMPYRAGSIAHDLQFSQMHAPYPVRVSGREGQNHYMRSEVIPKSLMVAGFLEIPYVVIHPFKMQYQCSSEEEYRQNMEYFKSLIPMARENHVIICLENLYESMGGRLVEGVCADPDEAVRYVDTLNQAAGEERFGFCLDTGHLNLCKADIYTAICKLETRLKILHLHENDGLEDLHQLPYTFGNHTGDGLDWEGVLRGLREIRYCGVLNFETYPSMNSFPKAIQIQVLKTIARIGRYFSDRMEER